MTQTVQWYPVKDALVDGKVIGAVGFLGAEAVAAVSFHDKMDANRDGKVSRWEYWCYKLAPFSLAPVGTAQVISAAWGQFNMNLGSHLSQARARSLGDMRKEALVKMGSGMFLDAVYKTYFGRAIGTLVGMGTKLRFGLVKELVIRQAVSKKVKKAFDYAIKNPLLEDAETY